MSTVATYTAEKNPKGYQQITVSTTAVGLTVPDGATRAVLGIEAQPLRYRTDGTNPTASVGMLQAASTFVELSGADTLANFKAIRSGGTDSVLNVSYYGSN